jgi:citrate synthase
LLRELRPGHDLYTNVEFYASIVLEAVGLPPDLFTPTFALSRMVGWSAHIMEQLADPRIMRPAARYVGPPPPIPVPDLDG